MRADESRVRAARRPHGVQDSVQHGVQHGDGRKGSPEVSSIIREGSRGILIRLSVQTSENNPLVLAEDTSLSPMQSF